MAFFLRYVMENLEFRIISLPLSLSPSAPSAPSLPLLPLSLYSLTHIYTNPVPTSILGLNHF